MNCLSDSLCGAASALDWIITASAAIDYYGALLFGSQWQAIGPDVAAHADALQAFVVDFLDRPPGGCQRYAGTGVFSG